MNNTKQTVEAVWYKSPAGLGLLSILGIAGAFFLVEHWEHALPYLPWLLILACPLMHLLMHGGHRAKSGHAGHGGGCCGGNSGETALKNEVEQPEGKSNH